MLPPPSSSPPLLRQCCCASPDSRYCLPSWQVDGFVANYLRQETLEKDKREQLDLHIAHIKELEEQIVMWISEEHKQTKTVSVLTAQREIKAREASRYGMQVGGTWVLLFAQPF